MYPDPNRQPVPIVVRPARQCPNGTHLVLTIVTLGLWYPIWLIDIIVCRMSKPKIEYH